MESGERSTRLELKERGFELGLEEYSFWVGWMKLWSGLYPFGTM